MIYKFICPLFRIDIRLVLGDKKQIKHLTDPSNNDSFNASIDVVEKANGTLDYFLVWVEDLTGYNAMVHETLHLTKRIFNLVGVPFASDNDEIIAYYQNYWVRQFWHKMSNHVKEKQ